MSFDGLDDRARALQRVEASAGFPSRRVFDLKVHQMLFYAGVER